MNSAIVLLYVLTASSAWPPCAAGAEVLYNGIVLSDPWPPQNRVNLRDVMPVPYLKHPPAVVPIDVGRQLFVDDFLIEKTTLRREFHRPVPYKGNPILRADRPWEFESDPNQRKKGYYGPNAIPNSDGVWYDPKDKLYKMWYMGGTLHCTCYVVSKDGLRWTKPSLPVVRGTNIVHPGNRSTNTVWLDYEEKNPQRRFKMFRYAKTSHGGLILHYSPDGIRWSKEIKWAGPCFDRTTAFYNPFRKVWVISAKGAVSYRGDGYNYIRIRRYHEGRDPVAAMDWKGYNDAVFWVCSDKMDPINPDPKVNFPSQLYNLDCVAYESLMLGLFTIWQGPPNKVVARGERPKRNELFVGFSRDGFHWYRPQPRRRFIGVSEKRGAWNWGNVQSVGGLCLVVGDTLRFYHAGRAGSARLGKKKSSMADASTGVAFLRRDGFASMDAGAGGGVLTTRPVTFHGKHLFVNVDADGGELRVEVLDKAGRVIEPFSRDACDAIQADKTLQPVVWRGTDDFERDLSAVAGKELRFRFHLRSGRLFSFWVSPEASGASHGYVAAGGPGFTGPKDTVGLGAYGK